MIEAHKDINEEKSFAELFDEAPVKKDFLTPGQKVDAAIVKITTDWIFLDLGGKSEGYLSITELADEEGNLLVKEGDIITAYFLSSKHNEKLFTTKIGVGDSAMMYMEEIWQHGIPIEGIVEKEIKGGYEIRLVGGLRGFCPYSQMGLQRMDRAQNNYVGRRQSFKITEYKDHGRNIILSSRVLMEEQRKKNEEALKGSLKEGMIVKGSVVSIKSYGAFLDINGFQGLLPISEIGWERVENIHDHLAVGQEIEVTITGLDWERNRISLSLKQMLSDPWNDMTAKYFEGAVYEGKVVRLASFGAFISLCSGIDGLIHISKLGKGRRITHPREVIKLGEIMRVKIDSIDREQKRISLSIPVEVLKDDESGKSGGDLEDDYRQYIGKSQTAMGSLGDIIKRKTEEKIGQRKMNKNKR